MVESIKDRYVLLNGADDNSTVIERAVFVAELVVIDLSESEEVDLSVEEINRRALDYVSMLISSGQLGNDVPRQLEIRTYDELVQFVNGVTVNEGNVDDISNDSNGVSNSDTYSSGDFGVDGFDLSFDEESEEGIQQPSNLVIRRGGNSEEVRVTSNQNTRNDQPTVGDGSDDFDLNFTGWLPEDIENAIAESELASIESFEQNEEYDKVYSFIESNELLMSYFLSGVGVRQPSINDNGAVPLDYSINIFIISSDDTPNESYLSDSIESAIEYLTSLGFTFNEHFNVFTLKENTEIIKYARILMDVDLRGILGHGSR